MCLWIHIRRCVILFLRHFLLCSQTALWKSLIIFFFSNANSESWHQNRNSHFDSTIKPISLYGAEIWGYFNPFARKIHILGCAVDEMYSNTTVYYLLVLVLLLVKITWPMFLLKKFKATSWKKTAEIVSIFLRTLNKMPIQSNNLVEYM